MEDGGSDRVAGKALKTPPKSLPKPTSRERSRSSAGFIDTQSLKKPSLVGKGIKSDANEWKMRALNFHDQVVKEVERLIQNVEDKEVLNKACDLLKKVQVPLKSRNKLTPEKFVEKTEPVVTLLQRIELQHPAVLRPPPV